MYFQTETFKRNSTAEMRFMRKTAGYTLWDRKKSVEMLSNLKVTPMLEHLQNYRRKLIYIFIE